MSFISRPVPDFRLDTVMADPLRLHPVEHLDYRGSWLMLLFYPRDFSFVCPTELSGFSHRITEFQHRNCQILGVSVDTIASHREWLESSVAEGGLGPLQFPLAADPGGGLARQLGIWLEAEQVSARGLFLADPQGVIQYGVVHNLSVGRSVDETLRVLDALQSGGLCPASWTSADGTIDLEKAIQPGRVVGHYRIRRKLGEGAASTVFAAWDLRLERSVALKVLKRLGEESREESLREARAVAPLNHPNVCQIYAIEQQDDLSLIVMEHIRGHTLKELIRDQLPSDDRVAIARGIAAGLAAAHALQIIHGDLKPANILVTEDLVPRILDFGLSRKVPKSQNTMSPRTATQPPADVPLSVTSRLGDDLVATVSMPLTDQRADSARTLSGTPAYMSWELWQGQPATSASDVFSWGLLMFELMTGHRALSAEHVAGLLLQVRDAERPAIQARELPLRLREIYIATQHPDPARRPTAEMLVDALRDA